MHYMRTNRQLCVMLGTCYVLYNGLYEYKRIIILTNLPGVPDIQFVIYHISIGNPY